MLTGTDDGSWLGNVRATHELACYCNQYLADILQVYLFILI